MYQTYMPPEILACATADRIISKHGIDKTIYFVDGMLEIMSWCDCLDRVRFCGKVRAKTLSLKKRNYMTELKTWAIVSLLPIYNRILADEQEHYRRLQEYNTESARRLMVHSQALINHVESLIDNIKNAD